jgi:hypothetical protein
VNLHLVRNARLFFSRCQVELGNAVANEVTLHTPTTRLPANSAQFQFVIPFVPFRTMYSRNPLMFHAPLECVGHAGAFTKAATPPQPRAKNSSALVAI